MNVATIVGNLTKDVEYSVDGPRSNFTVAVNRVWVKDGEKQEETDFIPVVVFGKSAENCMKFLRKGSKVGIEGRISVRNYEKDGQKRTYTSIVARYVEFLTPKGDQQSGARPMGEDESPFVDGTPQDARMPGDEEVPF